MFPGLGGGSDRGYVKSLAKTLLEGGYEVAVIHVIGTGNTPYTSPHYTDLSSNEEIAACVRFVVEEAKTTDIVAVGLSLGGNQMLKFAGETPSCPFKVMVSVNNPFDITMNNNLMRDTIYEKYLIKDTLRNVVLPFDRATRDQEREVFTEMAAKFGLEFERLKQIKTWREFDAQFTSKVNPHFRSATAYYNAASALTSLHDVKVPTLVVHAMDDKITPVRCVPVEDLLQNENFIIALTARGSHVCYYYRWGTGNRWFSDVAVEFMDAALSLNN